MNYQLKRQVQKTLNLKNKNKRMILIKGIHKFSKLMKLNKMELREINKEKITIKKIVT